jgi:ubiquinone/menaquinone biosynthesis C-methylase UbiE
LYNPTGAGHLVTAVHHPDWNSFARTQAGQKWRSQSAAMGSAMTEAIVQAAQVSPGMSVLDIACGSGEPAISLATLLQDSGAVIGVDMAESALKTARERARHRGLANVRFQSADAHHLPFADAQFDRVTSRLGIMFFADLPNALREMRRVLKPSGRVTLLTWGVMGQPYFSSTIGTLLRCLPGSSMPQNALRMFAFGQPGLLAGQLRAAGFESAKEEFLTIPWTWPGTAREVWEYFQEVTVPFAPLLQSIPADRREEVDAKVIQAITEYQEGNEVRFTAKVNISSAVK